MKYLFVFLIVSILTYKVSDLAVKGKLNLPDYLDFVEFDKQINNGDTIHIYGFGKFDYKKLLIAKISIEKRCHLPISIEKPINIKVNELVNEEVDIDKCLETYDDYNNKILITDLPCYSISIQKYVGAISEYEGNIVIIGKNQTNTIERVLIHEIGHCYGLKHCLNYFCVMSKKRDNDNKKLNFCNECKTKF